MARRPSAAESLRIPLSPEISRQNGSANVSAHSTHLTGRPTTRVVSSSQKPKAALSLDELEPDELFIRHSVSDVRIVQQRLRTDADAKQEELRLMVGERYRDLLEASTSILALAKSSRHVLEALEEMRGTVGVINPARTTQRTSTGEDKHLQALQSLSAYVKLLLDAPEHLWRLMEKKVYLNAAWLFLLARVVHRALSQEDDDQSWQAYGIDVAEQMPLVQRQWDSIVPFRSQISHRATLSLREISSTPGEVCATLLTLHILESRPLPETLSIYLAQRMKTLSNMLTGNPSTSNLAAGTSGPKLNDKSSHRPRKGILRETKQKAEAILDLIAQTMGTARQVFANEAASPSLMYQALQYFKTPASMPSTLPMELQMSTQILLTGLPSSGHFLLLPPSIRTYTPYIDGATVVTATLQPHLQDKLENWFRKAILDARSALTAWFSELSTVRDVWDVRASLLTWLKAVGGLTKTEQATLQSIIDSTCQYQATAVWKVALKQLQHDFQSSITSALSTLSENASEHPYDVQPVEHLFQAPPLPSVLQTSALLGSVGSHLDKYKSTLRQQLCGRTPLLDLIVSALERSAKEMQEDLAVVRKSEESTSELVSQLFSSYCQDAENVCTEICDVLDAAAHTAYMPQKSTFIARVCKELGSASSFFFCMGCSTDSAHAFRARLRNLHGFLVHKWKEATVQNVLSENFREREPNCTAKPHTPQIPPPNKPSPTLVQALLSLSSGLQQLGVCLDGDSRKEWATSTLEHFTSAYLDHLDRPSCGSDLQHIFDLIFLRELVGLWSIDANGVLGRVSATITHLAERVQNAKYPSNSLDVSVREYLRRAQILLAGLVPSIPPAPAEGSSPTKTDKISALLLYGAPAVEQRFEPALELAKPPPRFGLLLVGGSSNR